MNAIAMPKQIPAACSRVPLLPELFLLVLHIPLANGLLAARLELLVDLIELLDLLLRDLLLGLEVGAEPALDALYAVWAQHVCALELTACTTLVERGDVFEALASHLPVSLLPVSCVSCCCFQTSDFWRALHVTGLLLGHGLEDSLP